MHAWLQTEPASPTKELAWRQHTRQAGALAALYRIHVVGHGHLCLRGPGRHVAASLQLVLRCWRRVCISNSLAAPSSSCTRLLLLPLLLAGRRQRHPRPSWLLVLVPLRCPRKAPCSRLRQLLLWLLPLWWRRRPRKAWLLQLLRLLLHSPRGARCC
jgi:hypothetical protein